MSNKNRQLSVTAVLAKGLPSSSHYATKMEAHQEVGGQLIKELCQGDSPYLISVENWEDVDDESRSYTVQVTYRSIRNEL